MGNIDKIKVLIADDHAMLRCGLKQVLELEKDIVVIAQASDGEEAVRLVKKYVPDVILMDINMPKLNGTQAIKKLKEEEICGPDGKDPKIIVLTIHQDREYLMQTLHIGAKGYVLKDAEPDILIDAIRSVCNGQTYIQACMTGQLVDELNKVQLHGKNGNDENSLTSREFEVLEQIAKGMSNKEIASSLQISEKTVKNHVSSIFRKLDVYDRTQAAIYALKHGV